MSDRARRIVKLAATKTKLESIRSWLLCDERGTHEASAARYLEVTAEKAAQLGLTEEQVDNEIAARLAFDAVSAELQTARKKQR